MDRQKKHQHILDRLILRDFKAYKVLIGGPGSKTILAENNEGKVNAESLSGELDAILASNTGNFTIVLSQKTKLEKSRGGDLGTDENIPFDNRELQNTTGIHGYNQMARNDSTDKLLELQAAAHAKEIADLKERFALEKRLDKMEQDNSNPAMDKILTIAGPLLTQMLTKTPAAIAGHEQVAEVVEGEANERAAAAINRLSVVYPNIVEILEQLAHFAENSKEACDMALKMLPKLEN